ncbi:MAG: efflux RND transporter periplasmic adaptor subunit [Bacteroidia bacterium]
MINILVIKPDYFITLHKHCFMYQRILLLFIAFSVFSCKNKQETVKPERSSITESVYASGVIKSKNQYQVFPSVNGIIDTVLVSEGDSVKAGTPIIIISGKIQKLNKELAQLNASYTDADANREKLDDAAMQLQLAKSKMQSDSLFYFRQKNLWEKQVGSKAELELKELAFANSRTAYYTARTRYNDLKKQLDFTSQQSKKNLQLTDVIQDDYTIKSDIDGIVYSVLKSQGELAGVQTPVAIIGDAADFILEMQVDEYDILKLRKDQKVIVRLDSYKGKVFDAVITKINPIMNERSKTFLVEASFITRPEILYPNITFEASVVINEKENVLLIPRNYMLNDSTVLNTNNEQVVIRTGLKDYKKVEVLSGISEADELLKPE